MTAFPDDLTPQTFIPYAAGCALEKLTAGQSPREVERYLEELYEAYADHEPRAYDGDLELDDGFVPVESYHMGLGFVNDEGEAGMDMAMLKLQRLSLLPQESPIAGHPLSADQPAEHILSHEAFTDFTAGDLESKKQAIVAFAAAAADGANPIGPTWLGPIAPYVSQSQALLNNLDEREGDACFAGFGGHYDPGMGMFVPMRNPVFLKSDSDGEDFDDAIDESLADDMWYEHTFYGPDRRWTTLNVGLLVLAGLIKENRATFPFYLFHLEHDDGAGAIIVKIEG